jgi:hypothetical protein
VAVLKVVVLLHTSTAEAMEGDSPASLPKPPIHLIVLQHGLWGNTTCVSNLEEYLRQHLAPKRPHQHSSTAEAGATDDADADPATATAASDPAGQHEAEVQILNSDVNRKALTYDGEEYSTGTAVMVV